MDNLLPEMDINSEMDFTSELFNPQKVLEADCVTLPYPNARPYNNLAEYKSVVPSKTKQPRNKARKLANDAPTQNGGRHFESQRSDHTEVFQDNSGRLEIKDSTMENPIMKRCELEKSRSNFCKEQEKFGHCVSEKNFGGFLLNSPRKTSEDIGNSSGNSMSKIPPNESNVSHLGKNGLSNDKEQRKYFSRSASKHNAPISIQSSSQQKKTSEETSENEIFRKNSSGDSVLSLTIDAGQLQLFGESSGTEIIQSSENFSRKDETYSQSHVREKKGVNDNTTSRFEVDETIIGSPKRSEIIENKNKTERHTKTTSENFGTNFSSNTPDERSEHSRGMLKNSVHQKEKRVSRDILIPETQESAEEQGHTEEFRDKNNEKRTEGGSSSVSKHLAANDDITWRFQADDTIIGRPKRQGIPEKTGKMERHSKTTSENFGAEFPSNPDERREHNKRMLKNSVHQKEKRVCRDELIPETQEYVEEQGHAEEFRERKMEKRRTEGSSSSVSKHLAANNECNERKRKRQHHSNRDEESRNSFRVGESFHCQLKATNNTSDHGRDHHSSNFDKDRYDHPNFEDPDNSKRHYKCRSTHDESYDHSKSDEIDRNRFRNNRGHYSDVRYDRYGRERFRDDGRHRYQRYGRNYRGSLEYDRNRRDRSRYDRGNHHDNFRNSGNHHNNSKYSDFRCDTYDRPRKRRKFDNEDKVLPKQKEMKEEMFDDCACCHPKCDKKHSKNQTHKSESKLDQGKSGNVSISNRHGRRTDCVEGEISDSDSGKVMDIDTMQFPTGDRNLQKNDKFNEPMQIGEKSLKKGIRDQNHQRKSDEFGNRGSDNNTQTCKARGLSEVNSEVSYGKRDYSEQRFTKRMEESSENHNEKMREVPKKCAQSVYANRHTYDVPEEHSGGSEAENVSVIAKHGDGKKQTSLLDYKGFSTKSSTHTVTKEESCNVVGDTSQTSTEFINNNQSTCHFDRRECNSSDRTHLKSTPNTLPLHKTINRREKIGDRDCFRNMSEEDDQGECEYEFKEQPCRRRNPELNGNWNSELQVKHSGGSIETEQAVENNGTGGNRLVHISATNSDSPRNFLNNVGESRSVELRHNIINADLGNNDVGSHTVNFKVMHPHENCETENQRECAEGGNCGLPGRNPSEDYRSGEQKKDGHDAQIQRITGLFGSISDEEESKDDLQLTQLEKRYLEERSHSSSDKVRNFQTRSDGESRVDELSGSSGLEENDDESFDSDNSYSDEDTSNDDLEDGVLERMPVKDTKESRENFNSDLEDGAGGLERTPVKDTRESCENLNGDLEDGAVGIECAEGSNCGLPLRNPNEDFCSDEQKADSRNAHVQRIADLFGSISDEQHSADQLQLAQLEKKDLEGRTTSSSDEIRKFQARSGGESRVDVSFENSRAEENDDESFHGDNSYSDEDTCSYDLEDGLLERTPVKDTKESCEKLNGELLDMDDDFEDGAGVLERTPVKDKREPFENLNGELQNRYAATNSEVVERFRNCEMDTTQNFESQVSEFSESLLDNELQHSVDEFRCLSLEKSFGRDASSTGNSKITQCTQNHELEKQHQFGLDNSRDNADRVMDNEDNEVNLSVKEAVTPHETNQKEDCGTMYQNMMLRNQNVSGDCVCKHHKHCGENETDGKGTVVIRIFHDKSTQVNFDTGEIHDVDIDVNVVQVKVILRGSDACTEEYKKSLLQNYEKLLMKRHENDVRRSTTDTEFNDHSGNKEAGE